MIQTVTLEHALNFYSSPASDRYSKLIQRFQSQFKSKPQFVARAPGRVNIIGEHIDYEGYGVLPAAIEKDCIILYKKVQSEIIQIVHALNEHFPAATLSKYPSKIWENIPHPYTKYFAAGYRAGLLDLVESEQNVTGLQILIQGNIPWASGISSSSAFCVCCALLSHHANKTKQISKQQFVERCIRFQREVGTASGGMDQSISFLGKKGSCLYIQFNPIRGERVQVPLQNHKLIVMNSLVQSPKMQTAVYRYNKRVCQCRIATRLLSKNLQIPRQTYQNWKILKDVQQHLKLSLGEMLPLVDQHIPRHNYTQEQLQKLLQVPLIQIIGDIQRAEDVLTANKQYKIYQAAYHVYSEAHRVLQFIRVSRSNVQNQQKVKILGELMNQSQYSCRDLYECSCPEIQQLTTLARKNGALGSRLTGAGWGGCTVSIIPSEIQGKFIQALKQAYYSKPEIQKRIQFGVETAIFATQPSEGAFVIQLK